MGNGLLTMLGQFGYALVFGVILLENLGLPLPGFALLIMAGALAGAGKLSLALTLAAAVAGALLGDLVWYGLGRWRGRPVLGLLCRLSLNPDTCVGSTERFFLRHGLPTLLIAKFIPGVNTIAPPLMGTLRARFGPFLAYDSGGALIFAAVTVGVGYVLGREVADRLESVAAQAGTLLGWTAAALGIGYVGWRLWLRLSTRRALRTVGLVPEELARRLDDAAAPIVIDVRSPLAVRENPVRIRGALHATPEELTALVATLPAGRAIVTYCV